MVTHLRGEIDDRIKAYIDGSLTAAEFADWFWPLSWSIAGKGDSWTDDVVAAVELALSEYTAGHIDEAELRLVMLDSHVRLWIRLGTGPHVRASSNSVTIGNGEIIYSLDATEPRPSVTSYRRFEEVTL